MAQIVKIRVTATDNELYVLGINDGGGSSEICHIKSGMGNGVEYEVIPQSILSPGTYILVILGINWGGPSMFTVIFTDSTGASTTINGGTGLLAGGTWSRAITCTI